MNTRSSIGIVIPVYNRKEFTRACLQSLYRQTTRAERIAIVDDGSTDGTSEMLAREFPDVVVLHGDGNLFWTASINMGIRLCLTLGVEYILTLNNDTICSETFLEEMMAGGQATYPSLIGALDVDANSRQPYYGGEVIDWKWSRSRYLLDGLGEDERRGLHEVSLFPARGLLIPRIVFDSIGMFDEIHLPHYMADYDFTLLAKRNGFKIYCNYDAVLYTYPEEGGDHKIRKRKSLANYFKHLFSIKGGGNLKNFTYYAFRNCPPGSMLSCLVTGYTRRLVGFWLKGTET